MGYGVFRIGSHLFCVRFVSDPCQIDLAPLLVRCSPPRIGEAADSPVRGEGSVPGLLPGNGPFPLGAYRLSLHMDRYWGSKPGLWWARPGLVSIPALGPMGVRCFFLLICSAA